jgi:hypothetical protein
MKLDFENRFLKEIDHVKNVFKKKIVIENRSYMIDGSKIFIDDRS